MKKTYKISRLYKFIPIGPKKYGAVINNGSLSFPDISGMTIIQIGTIGSICYDLHSSGDIDTYCYIITLKNKNEYYLPYTLMTGLVFQELLKDLKTLNPDIRIDSELQEFVNKEIVPKKFKFDFTVHKGEFFRRDKEFSRMYPALDVVFGFSMILLLLLFSILSGIFGNKLLIVKYGTTYELYRIILLIISGLFLGTAVSNILMALISMYLGHKLTIGLFLCSWICISFGFII